MGVLGDTLDEFKHASKTEKVFIVGGVAAAIAIMLYVRNQASGSQGSPGVGGSGSAASLQGSSAQGGIQTVPGPNSSQVPILPPGLNPIYDGLGNLIGYQPITQGQLPPAQTPPLPSTPFNPRSPALPYGTTVPSKLGDLFSYQGTQYTIVPGPSGIIYGAVGKMTPQQAQNTPIGTGKYVLTAPISTYQQYKLSTVKQGGGPYGTRVLSVHGSKIAPIRERSQSTFVTSLYSSVNRHHR